MSLINHNTFKKNNILFLCVYDLRFVHHRYIHTRVPLLKLPVITLLRYQLCFLPKLPFYHGASIYVTVFLSCLEHGGCHFEHWTQIHIFLIFSCRFYAISLTISCCLLSSVLNMMVLNMMAYHRIRMDINCLCNTHSFKCLTSSIVVYIVCTRITPISYFWLHARHNTRFSKSGYFAPVINTPICLIHVSGYAVWLGQRIA
jgi:hypothetical protein